MDIIQTHGHGQSDTNSLETWTLIGPLWVETRVQIQTLICLFEFENMPIADNLFLKFLFEFELGHGTRI